MKTLGSKFILATAGLCLAALCLLSGRAPAKTADEEAARISALSAMEPVPAAAVAVQPLIAAEETWDIEDERLPAEEPLLRTLRCLTGEAGCDAATRTFYVCIGSSLEEWPELLLTGEGADGLQLAWADDYAWDYPDEAVAGSQRYRILAWTQERYEYVEVIFTGLPIVSVHTMDRETPGDAYMPARVSVSAKGYEPVSSVAQVHKRGGGYRDPEKYSLRVEFAERKNKGGYRKGRPSLLGMAADSDWLLISNDTDETLMRNAMGWQLWQKMNPEREAFALLESRMVEVCVNDCYMGVYALQQRIKPERELLRMGGSSSDLSARIILKEGIEERPVLDTSAVFNGGWLELRYKPETMTVSDAFAAYEDLLRLSSPQDSVNGLDDEAFLALAQKRVDTGALMRYLLFFEAAALGDDNTKNNLYFWCVHRDGRQLYYLSPWDMDQGFNDHGSVGGDVNFSLALPIRLLTLDAPGCREALWRDWKAFREGVLSESAVYEWMDGIETEMNASGAMLRESERWPGRPDRMDLMADRVYLLEHLEALDRDFKNLWPLPETEAAP